MMKILTPGFDLDLFFDDLASKKQRALLLDYDGTLAPFRIERDQAAPYPGVRKILNAILKTGVCRVVLVTGRQLQDLIPLIGLSQIPEIWGSHGIERLLPGNSNGYEVAEIGEGPSRGLVEAYARAQRQGLQDLCEQKPGCLALHLRGVGKANEMRDKAIEAWHPLAQHTGLTLHEFNGGLELRVPVRNKGSAVETVLSEMGKNTGAAYLGDDLTDEDAFRAMGDKGLSVLVRKEFHPTRANLWLRPPDELLEFLKNWNRICEGSI